MKQLFIALVVINLALPLFQGTSEEPAVGVAAPLVGIEAEAAQVSAVEKLPAKKRPEPGETGANAAKKDAEDSAAVPTPKASAVAQSEEQNSTADPADPADPAEVSSLAASTDPQAASCVIAGPFRKKGDAENLIKQLANSDIESTLQPRDTDLLPDYMVYVGPERSIARAREVAADFAAKNMDSHPIGSGDLANAVSLGVFSRQPLANELHEQLKGDGYKPGIVRITRNRRGFQVLTSLPNQLRSRLIAADTPMIDCPVDAPPAGALAKAS